MILHLGSDKMMVAAYETKKGKLSPETEEMIPFIATTPNSHLLKNKSQFFLIAMRSAVFFVTFTWPRAYNVPRIYPVHYDLLVLTFLDQSTSSPILLI